jgi:hypothetical protein
VVVGKVTNDKRFGRPLYAERVQVAKTTVDKLKHEISNCKLFYECNLTKL